MAALLATTVVALGACSDDPTPAGVDGAETLLLSVEPPGGATGVDIGTSIMITFDHPMSSAMSDFAALHEGDVDGPEVAGAWSLADEATALSFGPTSPLRPATRYTIHVAGGMRDAEGGYVDFEAHGFQMGGTWATAGMMGGGMAPGMGEGWRHPSNGSYGMVFSFTTG